MFQLVRVVKLKSQEHECSQSQEGKASLIGRMPVIVDNVSTAQQEGCPGNQDRRWWAGRGHSTLDANHYVQQFYKMQHIIL